jgi:hypothetical protein
MFFSESLEKKGKPADNLKVAISEKILSILDFIAEKSDYSNAKI